MSYNLDEKDRKILQELEYNSRQTDSQIAKKVSLSRDSVSYRIKKLEDDGLINYFMTIINTMKLGYEWYRTFFKFRGATTKQEEEIIEHLKQKVSWMSKVEGKWDINTGVFCKNSYEYKDFISELLEKYGFLINSYDVAIVTREWTYAHHFTQTKNTNTLEMGFGSQKKRVIEDIDETDYKIINTILKNARMKTIDIAKKINSTEIVVRYRIKKLIEKKIILGFKPFLNIEKLGLEYFKLHIKLNNHNSQTKKEILNYLHSNKATAHTTELIGGDDIETEFQVKNNKEFYNIIGDLRKEFKEAIREYYFMQYSKEYKFTYLPEINF